MPSTETDKESHAQDNIDRKDTEVNSSSASTASLVDVTVIESPEQLKESMVSEHKPVQAVNEKNEDEDVVKADTNTLSLLEQETPHCSPDEFTCNILKKQKITNLEEQEDNTEKAGSLLTGTSEDEQINAAEKIDQNHLMLETGSTQEVKAKAQGSRSRDDEKQQMAETVPLKTEKLEMTEFQKSIPEKVDSTERKNVSQLQQGTITRNSDAVGDNPELSEVKPEEEAPHWEEKGEHEETTLASMPRDASPHDLLQTSKKDISWVTDDFLPETETSVTQEEVKDVETEKAQNEEPITDEEGEGDEDKRKESAYESPVKVEAPTDIDVKAAQKKSHNILSGVGSKVKQSIKKVKKAITGKSSHPKPSSPK